MPNPFSKFYTIKKGDTLWKIQEQTGVPWPEIAKLNDIKDPRKIQPGMVMQVPQAMSEEDRLRIQSTEAAPAHAEAMAERPSVAPPESKLDLDPTGFMIDMGGPEPGPSMEGGGPAVSSRPPHEVGNVPFGELKPGGDAIPMPRWMTHENPSIGFMEEAVPEALSVAGGHFNRVRGLGAVIEPTAARSAFSRAYRSALRPLEHANEELTRSMQRLYELAPKKEADNVLRNAFRRFAGDRPQAKRDPLPEGYGARKGNPESVVSKSRQRQDTKRQVQEGVGKVNKAQQEIDPIFEGGPDYLPFEQPITYPEVEGPLTFVPNAPPGALRAEPYPPSDLGPEGTVDNSFPGMLEGVGGPEGAARILSGIADRPPSSNIEDRRNWGPMEDALEYVNQVYGEGFANRAVKYQDSLAPRNPYQQSVIGAAERIQRDPRWAWGSNVPKGVHDTYALQVGSTPGKQFDQPYVYEHPELLRAQSPGDKVERPPYPEAGNRLDFEPSYFDMEPSTDEWQKIEDLIDQILGPEK